MLASVCKVADPVDRGRARVPSQGRSEGLLLLTPSAETASRSGHHPDRGPLELARLLPPVVHSGVIVGSTIFLHHWPLLVEWDNPPVTRLCEIHASSVSYDRKFG